MKTERTILTLAVLGSLVLLNIIVYFNRSARLDFTRDGQFTLSEATADTLRKLTAAGQAAGIKPNGAYVESIAVDRESWRARKQNDHA